MQKRIVEFESQNDEPAETGDAYYDKQLALLNDKISKIEARQSIL